MHATNTACVDREEMTLEALTNLLIRKHPHAYPVDDLFNTLCSEDGFIPREFWKKYVKFLGDAYFNGMIFKVYTITASVNVS